MAYGRPGITNHAQMLGEAFLINVIHAPGKDRDGNDKTYANMKDADFNWQISAPMQTDALTGETTKLPVPDPTIDLRLLLWDNPTKEQWDSVFIDGDRTVKNEAGEDVTESKNWLQKDIVTNALNFAGSPLEQMLNGVADLELPGDVADEPVPHTDVATVEQNKAAAQAAQATYDKAAADAALAIKASDEAREKIAETEVPVTDRVATAGKSVPQSTEDALAAAQAIIAELTGK